MRQPIKLGNCMGFLQKKSQIFQQTINLFPEHSTLANTETLLAPPSPY
jgi:hypothetical protein